ncbi:leucine-rich repeat protein, putative [Plasmodium gallinaceum]|uniref:Leucine-rich repeat protein, putative n=1 Tax=Plasmodium gallinaceum TaxID=5849 RepID=A0A1J1GWD0_PLAGA|nr:leucine-rich repeat protein, putative [Plasmodium gallinaceum]CRG96849.1 leucine-rich repeat protein, putative [Plasmodium gallinaceum]
MFNNEKMSETKEEYKEDKKNYLNYEKREDINNKIFYNTIAENDYKNISTNIINEKMLIEEIEKCNNVKKNNIIDEFYHVKNLSLENRKILLIQNINLLKNLEELYLDNNLIEELENLDELVNLKILSVSNNNIEEIKNLDNLINLSELNLHNNKIKKIENLNCNKNLKILILSKNCIENLENIFYLRCLEKIRFLNLIDNPICNIKNLSFYIISNLKNIKYFNNEILTIKNSQIEKNNIDNKTYEETKEIKNIHLSNNINDTNDYEKKLFEAHLYDITILSNSLFDEKKEPVVLFKIDNYLKIKEDYLQNIQNINSEIINKILILNEERKKSSDEFENEVENFISKSMLENISAYKKLKERAKKVIRDILNFLNLKEGIKNMMIKKCPDYYKKRLEINENKDLNDTFKNGIKGIWKNLNLNFDMLIFNEHQEGNECEKNDNISNKNENINIFVQKDNYIILKNYIENNIEENFFFRDKLINEELMNIVSLNNFIEKFKLNISKIIKVINDNIYDYFRKLEDLEQSYNSKILNFFSEVKNNNNDQPTIIFKEEEINEYYIYKGYRSNVLNNLEDIISNNYHKSSSFLVEEKKKYLFLKSRERIVEVENIVDMFNDLFYSYLYILHVK